MPRSCDAIEHVIVPRARDLGGFEVRRALPSAQPQMVGPFIFFDQMGPAEFLDRHRHRRAAASRTSGSPTVTYLFEGEILHRDSLGSALAIEPGEVNLMTAGRGIVHSERDDGRSTRARAAAVRHPGVDGAAESRTRRRAPAFAHYGVDELPRIEGEGKRVRLIMGDAVRPDARRPRSRTDCFYAEAVLAPGAVLPLDADYDERAIYIASGEIDIAGAVVRGGPAAGVPPGRPHLDPGDIATRG